MLAKTAEPAARSSVFQLRACAVAPGFEQLICRLELRPAMYHVPEDIGAFLLQYVRFPIFFVHRATANMTASVEKYVESYYPAGLGHLLAQRRPLCLCYGA